MKSKEKNKTPHMPLKKCKKPGRLEKLYIFSVIPRGLILKYKIRTNT